MLTHFSLAIFTFFIIACNTNEKREQLKDCSQLHTGKFDYRGDARSRIFITRNDSIQTELVEKTGLKATLKIKWISSCEYTLEFLEFSESVDPALLKMAQERVLRTRIIKISPNYYIAETSAGGNRYNQRDTILIIK